MTAALPPERRVRLTKLLGLLGSDHVGERANAGAMADKLLREAGLTWESLLNGAAERKPPPAYDPWELSPPPTPYWRKVTPLILVGDGLTAWERNFLEGLLARWDGDLTPKQQKAFDRIYRAYQARP